MLEVKLWMKIVAWITGWEVYYQTASEVRFKLRAAGEGQ